MITRFKIFESNFPDLRLITDLVRCIKNYNTIFKKGEVYEVVGTYGNPQRAIEEFGIKQGMPMECISTIVIKNNKDKAFNFKNNSSVKIWGKFSDYFELLTDEEMKYYRDVKKYNL
jgi:hypothetical protein